MSKERSAQNIAERVAAVMLTEDWASRALDLQLECAEPGYCRISLRVGEDMVNAHGIGHGGTTFSLADSAFALAANASNETSVASQCQISFLAPARPGDVLTAECKERHRKGRSGIYDVSVTNQNDELVALFRGWSRTTGGAVVRDDDRPSDPAATTD